MDGKNLSADSDITAPGRSNESMLIATDITEEFSIEISTEGNFLPVQNTNNITKIQVNIEKSIDKNLLLSDYNESTENADKYSIKPNELNEDKYCVGNEGSESKISNDYPVDDYLHDKNWLSHRKHVFILSSAGKPIYSLHGNEDKLATIFGVMQALVSFVQSNNDSIKYIMAVGVKFVFLVKSPIILVAVSKTDISVQQIHMQLNDVYNQILSTLTYSHMTKIYENRKNFDLRRLLTGSERLIDHLLINDTQNKKVSNNPFIYLTHSVRILPLPLTVRETITSAIQNNCSKIKNLVFALLIANNKLISLVRMKKYFLHPADMRLIFNLIECSESFKSAESWTPICLPKFDANGFLHAHVSYLAEDCQACLLLLSVERDVFFTLSEAKKKITEKLRRSNCLEAINEAIKTKGINLKSIGIPEIRHFVYKSKSSAQLLCSEIESPYNDPGQFERLESLYYDIHHRIHNIGRPLKLIYEMKEKEILLAWVTTGYELFITFEPIIDKLIVIKLVNKLLSWIKKEEDQIFILNAPTF